MTYQPDIKTVGEIKGTNTFRFRPEASGLSISIALVSNHIPGAPVTDQKGKFVGYVSEFDLLKAVKSGRSLESIKAQDIMNKELQAVEGSTPIEDVLKLMEEKHLLNIPVVKNGIVVETVSRHDLLRATLGVGLGIEHH